jgi:parallel beta-helix repeat protein
MSLELNTIRRRELLLGSLVLAGSQAAKCAGLPAARNVIRSVRELEEACRAGGHYTLLPETYVLDDKVLRPVSGTRITGIRGRTVLRKRTSPGPYRTRAFFDIEDAKNIIIEGVEFRHLSNRFEMGVIVRATSRGSAGHITVRDCVFSRCYVYIQRYVDTVAVQNNKFLLEGVVGGVGVGGEINKLNGKGLNLDGVVNNVRISDNYFERARTEAIDLNWNVQNVTIERNYCYNCNTDKINEVIDVGGDVKTTVSNQCRNIVITNNKIVNDMPGAMSTIGIHVKGRSTNVLVENNLIVRTGSMGGVGIRVWNADDTIIRGNTISGYDYGIATTDATQNLPQRCSILSNIIRNYRVDGVELRGAYFMVASNEIEGTGSTGSSIDIVNLTRSVIHDNKMRNSAASGTRTQTPSSDLRITSNRVYKPAGGHGYQLAAPRSIIERNTVEIVRQ